MINLLNSKRFWISLATIALISSLLAYYLLIYSKDRRQNFIDRKYRVLSRMGDNAIKIYNDLNKGVDLEWSNFEIELEKAYRVKKLSQEIDSLNKQYDAILYGESIDYRKLESLEKRLSEKTKEFYNGISSSKKVIDKTIETTLKQSSTDFNIQLESRSFWGRRHEKSDSIYFKTKYTITGGEYAYYMDYEEKSTIYYSTPVSTILKRLHAPSDVSDFFLIRSFKPKKSTISESSTYAPDTEKCCCCNEEKSSVEPTSVNKIAYQTLKNEVRLKNLDSLLYKEVGLHTNHPVDVEINGERYIILPYRIQFAADEDWIMCMLIKENDVNTYSRGLELWVLVNAFLLALFILITMPLIKLIVMSTIERLQILNVWFTGLSICVGTSLLILLILGLYHYFGHYRLTDNKLIQLADSVETNFSKELADIHHQLMQLNQIEDKTNAWNKDTTNSVKKVGYVAHAELLERKNNKTIDTSFFSKELQKKYFNEIIWIDKTGEQQIVLATHKVNPEEKSLNLSERSYFSRVLNNNLWPLPTSKKDSGQFALQSIRSWRSAKEEAGISIPLTDTAGWKARVLVMATKLYSVMDPVLPPGYGFCIIDKSGEVWFHSETTRNLQENFLQETNNEQLESAVYGRLSIETDATYQNKKMRVHTKPIKKTELFLITYYDLEYYKSPLVLTIGFTLFLIFLLYGLQGIQLLLLYLTTYRPTKLSIKRFYLSWMRPMPWNEESTKPYLEAYVKSVKAQLLLAFLMLIGLITTHERWLAFCFVMLPVFLLLYHFIVFRIIPKQNTKQTQEKRKEILNHPFTITSFILIVLCNTFAFSYIDSFVMALVGQSLILVLLVYVDKIKIGFLERWMQEVRGWSFPTPYLASMFLWLILAGVMSVFYFYKCGYHEELKAWNRFIQLETAFNVASRDENITNDLEVKNIQLKPAELVETTTLGNYIEATGEIEQNEKSSGFPEIPASPYYDLLFQVNPISSNLLQKGKSSIYPKSSDQQWLWLCNSRASVELQFKTTSVGNNSTSKNYFYTSTVPSFAFANTDYLLLFIIAIVAIAFLIFKVLQYTTDQIFGIKMTEHKKYDVSSEQELFETIYKSIENTIGKRAEQLFLVGLPHSGKTACIQYAENKLKANWQVEKVDCREVTIPVNSPARFLFLEHFEHGINNHAINEQKLKLLTAVCIDLNKTVVITSSMQPAVIFDYYEKKIGDLRYVFHQNKERDKDLWQELKEYKRALRMWKNLFSGFSIQYLPLQHTNLTPFVTLPPVVEAELNHGYYLNSLKDNLVTTDLTLATSFEREEFVLRVEEKAEPYYYSLWNSFSNEEKLVLFDLAKDRFVNIKNQQVLRSLLHKGVIVFKNSLRIMNRSFNNFILKVVKEDEEIEMEKQLKQKGVWQMVQLIMIIVFIGIAAFIALAQQNLLHNFNTLITAIGGITALLLRFGGLFGSTERGTKT